MSKAKRAANPVYDLLPREVEGFDSLAELALDMQWSWNHATDDVWRQLEPVLWELTHNAWAVLQTASRDRIEGLSRDPVFRKRVDDLMCSRRQAAKTPAWFQRTCPQSRLTCIAYFSMEFMLSEALPIYSGGLGNVAGDQLKAASDLGVPVIGVGLLYSQGYFRQVIDGDGAQRAVFPYNDPGQLPITPLRRSDGEWLRLKLDLSGHPLWLRAWQVRVGRLALYLLDSNDAANAPVYRGITSELYGGGPDVRLLQELVLGIGGWQLLAALGIHPEVCHLNEGHAAFAVLERAAQFHARDRPVVRGCIGRYASGQSLYDAHRRRRGVRPLRSERHRTLAGRVRGTAARDHAPRSSGAGPRESRRLRGGFQHGVSGNPWKRSGKRRQPPAWRREPTPVCAAVCALAGRRRPGRARDQWRSYADMGLRSGR